MLGEWYPEEDKEDFLNRVEVMENGRVEVYGNLSISLSDETPYIPHIIERVIGNIYIHSITHAQGLHIPKSYKLDLPSLTSAKHLRIPDGIWLLKLNDLPSAKHLRIPDSVRYLFLNNLRSAKHLRIPGGVIDLSLNNLTSIDGLDLNAVQNNTPPNTKLYVANLAGDLLEEIKDKYPKIIFEQW